MIIIPMADNQHIQLYDAAMLQKRHYHGIAGIKITKLRAGIKHQRFIFGFNNRRQSLTDI